MKQLLHTLSISACLLSSIPILSAQTNESVIASIRAEKFDEALKNAKKLIKKDPKAEGISNMLVQAGLHCIDKSEVARAITYFKLVVKRFPDTNKDTEEANSKLFDCYQQLRMLDEAIAQCHKNIKLYPKSKWFEFWTFQIGHCNHRIYNFEKGKVLQEAYLKKYPNGQYKKYAVKNLAALDPAWAKGVKVLAPYKGRFKDDVRILKAIKEFDKDLENSFVELERSLGVDLRDKNRSIVRFIDRDPKAKHGVKANASIIGVNGKPVVVMSYFTDFVVTNPLSYKITITHELKHAAFKSVMRQNYDKLPTWVKEGLAVYGSDDVQTRLGSVFTNIIASNKSPMETLDGIDELSRSYRDYAEDGLAFEWLESLKKGNVKAFCKGLLEGKDYKSLLSSISGLTYRQAMKAAEKHCHTRYQKALGNAYESYKKLQKESMTAGAGKKAKGWLAAGGRDRFDKWLGANDDHAAAPLARFYLARALVNAGEFEDARKLLKEIVLKDYQRCSLLDDAQSLLAASYFNGGDKKRGMAELGVLVRDYPNTSAGRAYLGKVKPAPYVTEMR